MDQEEYARIEGMLAYEKEKWQQGLRYVAGLDEAGRGPLAGPVVAAAVMFTETPYIPCVNDSKKLTADQRESLHEQIIADSLDYGIGIAHVDEIDRVNILQASYLAMNRAVEGMKIKPDVLLVDGRAYPNEGIPCEFIIKGDSLSFSIAAASILAKVTRDRIMQQYDEKYPDYGFSRHKGYATQLHLDAIEEYGFCDIHRQSFHPKRFLPQLELFPDANPRG